MAQTTSSQTHFMSLIHLVSMRLSGHVFLCVENLANKKASKEAFLRCGNYCAGAGGASVGGAAAGAAAGVSSSAGSKPSSFFVPLPSAIKLSRS